MPVVRSTLGPHYWGGEHCTTHVGGDIEGYISESLERQSLPLTVILLQADGVTQTPDAAPGLKSEAFCKTFGPDVAIGCICTRGVSGCTYIPLPNDDRVFREGLDAVLAPFPKPVWEDRTPIVFWRGSASGEWAQPCLRVRVVTCLYDHPRADVRLTAFGGWEDGKNIPPELFAPRCRVADQFVYKYLLIVDGNCSASNYQWTFGSGAVPLLISHPQNEVWFKSHLRPMVNYVPVAYDLSDLRERVDWLVAHDVEAKAIAENAMRLASTLFSPSGQRAYIDEALARANRLTSLARTSTRCTI